MGLKLPKHMEEEILRRSASPPVGVNLPVVRLDVAAAAHPGQRVSLTLPWCPSLSHYYRHVGAKVLISTKGREYRRAVISALFMSKGNPVVGGARLSVFVSLFPPNQRLFDLDNRLKGLFDAITHAGVWNDDSQIDHLSISRREVVAGGKVEVLIIPRREHAD